MSRKNVSDGLVEHLKGASGFDSVSSGTVIAHDHRVLSMGMERAAIILNERGEQNRLSMGGAAQLDWYFEVELWIRNKNNITATRQDSDTYTQAIIDRINTDSTLGGSAIDALVTETRVEDESMAIGGIQFLLEVLTVKATEYTTYA